MRERHVSDVEGESALITLEIPLHYLFFFNFCKIFLCVSGFFTVWKVFLLYKFIITFPGPPPPLVRAFFKLNRERESWARFK